MSIYNLSKQDLYERVGHMNQIAGFKKYVLQEGKKDGIHGVDLWNGSGLFLTIISDRASDISSLTYNGKSLCWLSNLGISSPGYGKDGDFDWNQNFSGGMFATCGLTTAGLPSVDDGEQLNLHGKISNLPSEEVSCRTFWKGNEFFVEYTGKTYQTRPFGECICLTRTVSIKAGENTVCVHDHVENLGFREEPFMMIYHMNFGYPLLDEGSRLYLTYQERFPTSVLAQQTESEVGVVTKPDPGYVARAYNHTVKPDGEGFAYASIVNEERKLGATIKFKAEELPKFNLWKCLQQSNYVVGLEPCNCRTWGRNKAREQEELVYLRPFESKELYFEIQIHEGDVQIEQAVMRYERAL